MPGDIEYRGHLTPSAFSSRRCPRRCARAAASYGLLVV